MPGWVASGTHCTKKHSEQMLYFPVSWHRVGIGVRITNICQATNNDVRRVADVLGETNNPLPLTGSTQR
jgi:hypothetical protein